MTAMTHLEFRLASLFSVCYDLYHCSCRPRSTLPSSLKVVAVVMKISICSISAIVVASVLVISTFGFVAHGANIEEEGQRGNKPGSAGSSGGVLDHELLRALALAPAATTKQGKAGKAQCACKLDLDYGGVCENQPFFYWFSVKVFDYVCERFENSLLGFDNEIGIPGYLYLYDKCLENYAERGEPMKSSSIYATAEECYNAHAEDNPKIIDACNQEQTTPSPRPTTKSGKGTKSECILNISNCTRTCSKDKTAYYFTKDDYQFGYYRNDWGLGNKYPTLVGGCHRYLDDEIAMITYSRCVENGPPLEKYKNLDECCSAKGGCSDYKTEDTPVWRIDQCIDPPPTAASAKVGNLFENAQYSSELNLKHCPTLRNCEQCITDLLTLFPANTPLPDTFVGSGTTAGLVDLKYVFDYTLVRSGSTVVAEEGVDTDLEANIGGCKPCIDYLVAKYTTPAFLLDKVVANPEETPQQSYMNNFFNRLLDEVVGLNRVSKIDLMQLYDSLVTYYTDEYDLSTQAEQGVRRATAKRVIDFKTGC
jgi:hypothetical protein